MKNLASHSSGLPREGDFDRYDGTEMPELKKILSFLEMDKLFNPDEDFHYSNVGYIILGIILEKVAKMPYKDYVVKKILRPLGMKFSGFDYNLQENKSNEAIGYLKTDEETQVAPKVSYGDCKPCGGLLTCIADLGKYINFLMKNNNDQVLKSSKELLLPHILYPPAKNNNKKIKPKAYGLGIDIADYDDEYRVYSHSGGTWGFTSFWLCIPDLDLRVVMWQNSDLSGLRDVLEKSLEIIVPAVKNAPKPQIEDLWKNLKQKNCYLHAMGDKIRIRRSGKENDQVLMMDYKERCGDLEKKIKLERIKDGNNKFKVLKGTGSREILQFVQRELENETLPKIIKFKGGLFYLSDQKF